MTCKLPSPSLSRRSLLVLGIALLAGCHGRAGGRAQTPRPPLSAEDEALRRKFRGLEGGQLVVDSLFVVTGLNIFDEKGRVFFRRAQFTPLEAISGAATARSLACRNS